MRRLLTATVLATILVAGTPSRVEAHSIRCAAYVGNPCYQQAYWHAWWHRVLANPLGILP